MRQRTITAIFFAIAMIAGVYGGKTAYFLLFSAITTGSIWELMHLLQDPADPFPRFRKIAGAVLGLIPFALLTYSRLFVTWQETQPDNSWVEMVFVQKLGIAAIFVLILVELFLAAPKPFNSLSHYLLGVAYVAVPFTLLAYFACSDAPGIPNIYHPNRVFGLLWLVWTNDTVAYLVGSRLGKRKIMERVSPKKTWEGTIAGGVGTILMAWLISIYVADFNQAQWLGLGAVVAVFATPGDLVESMLKRSVGVKDSGNLLPGHGGLLDRFDAFMFVVPFAWLVTDILQ
jgi:phosphatidate cytidylyltransferase